MDHCVYLVSASFFIEEKDKQVAFKRLQENFQSFISTPVTGLEEFVEHFGYYLGNDPKGNVCGIDLCSRMFRLENVRMFDVLAPFVRNRSYIELMGDDGSHWRWVFKDGHVYEIYPKVVWEE